MRGGSCLKTTSISNIQQYNRGSIFIYSLHEDELQIHTGEEPQLFVFKKKKKGTYDDVAEDELLVLL